jgi:hypothetical protein
MLRSVHQTVPDDLVQRLKELGITENTARYALKVGITSRDWRKHGNKAMEGWTWINMHEKRETAEVSTRTRANGR